MAHVSDKRKNWQIQSQAATSLWTSQIKVLMVFQATHRRLNPLSSLLRCTNSLICSPSWLLYRWRWCHSWWCSLRYKTSWERNPTEKRWVGDETMLRYNQQSWPTHTKQHCHCHCKYQTYGCQAESTFGCSSLVCSTFGNWRGASASVRHLDFHPAAHIWQLILPEEGKWIPGCKMEAGWWEVMEVSHRTAMTLQLKTYVPTHPVESHWNVPTLLDNCSIGGVYLAHRPRGKWHSDVEHEVSGSTALEH